MNNLRLFYQKKLSDNLIGNLDKKQSHYVSKVMRLRENDEFNVFNESGEWIAQIKKINKTGIEFQIVKQLRSKESRVDKRSIVRKINNDRLKKIIIEATEQSNRICTPEIESPVKLQNFLSTYEDKIKLIFTDLNSNKKKISLIKSEKKPLCILIGPEGDFSESERLKILNFKDVETIKLNDNILRSETAAISALSVINFIIN